jgi:hypothetical protein
LVRIQNDRRFAFGELEDRVESLLPLGVAKGVASRVRREDSQETAVRESDRKSAVVRIDSQGIDQRVLPALWQILPEDRFGGIR